MAGCRARYSAFRRSGSFLLCDEVGLGKTVEAGLALRQLFLSGQVRRALLLVPKSVLKQWQEELYEKFSLNVPCYDGGGLVDAFDREIELVGNAWNTGPLLLASSQLAKRRDRQGEVLVAEPWDLVLIDEAHHARRRDFLDDRFRPNRLLELLLGTPGRPGLRHRTRALYLLTATPMQVNPVEIWDLLKVMGLGGRWGAVQDNFLLYFRELRRSAADRDWEFLFSMFRDVVESPAAIDPDFASVAQRELGLVEWEVLKGLPWSPNPRSQLQHVGSQAKRFVDELLRRHTPIFKRVWRSTRSLLRRYQEKGMLQEKIPFRDPQNEWIPLSDGPSGEGELYARVEEYISDFYKKYEAQRKGLGFVMTVYRRRLTSSFYALQRSLERRLEFLEGRLDRGGLTDEDVDQDDLDRDVTEDLTDEERPAFAEERGYVETFLHEIKQLGSDSKFEQLVADLQTIFKKRDTVLVFTQYTDTMDYLREQLRHVHGTQVACYSGRGGERWDGVAWRTCPKEELKADFKAGSAVKILLCTESASEGLNLQTCGVLINYDMPWNPMRVEQRIGRIDRIGQKYDRVWIRNYFYRDTVEAVVYQRLSDRIHWFEDVVGGLEPILDQVGQTIEKVAMLPRGQRQKALEIQVAQIRARIEERKAESLDVASFVEDRVAELSAEPPPLALQDLENVLLGSESLGKLFRQDDRIQGAHRLSWRGSEHLVTFTPMIFDAHPNSVQLLTYGNPLLAEMLAHVEAGDSSGEPSGPCRLRIESPVRLSVFAAPTGGGPVTMPTLAAFRAMLESPSRQWAEGDAARALELAAHAAEFAVRRREDLAQRERHEQREGIREAARNVLLRTALIDTALNQAPNLFGTSGSIQFGRDGVERLRKEGSPYKALLKLLHPDIPATAPTDAFFLQVQSSQPAMLRRRRESLRAEGFEAVKRYVEFEKAAASETAVTKTQVLPTWYQVPHAAATRATGQATGSGVVRFLPVEEVRPYENCVPFFDLRAAAGAFSQFSNSERPQAEASQNPSDYRWVAVSAFVQPAPDLFVTQVFGESMNRRIRNGAFCLFRLDPQGGRSDRIVLAEHRAINDPDLGGRYTVKRYRSERRNLPDGSWRHQRIELLPDSTDPSYRPIVIDAEAAAELRIVAALVRVLDGGAAET